MKKLYAALSIVLMLAAAHAVQPAHAVVFQPGQQLDQSKSLSVPMATVTTPSYPIGIREGESQLVEYSLSETGDVSGEITERTLQFFTQYDDPLSEAQGPYPTRISIHASETTSWNELVYLPKAVVEQARAMDEYAIVLKTDFSGRTPSGTTFETSARLLLLLEPASFTKRAPGNGMELQPADLLLNWSSSVGAIDYEYCFDTVDNDRCDTDWTGTYWPSTYETKVVLKDLPINTTFYWQVRANNAAGQTYANEGDWWSFTTCQQNFITVTNTNDSGPGSLRHAIENVCTDGKITFAPSLSGQVIELDSPLSIHKNLIIDGSSLPQKLSLSGKKVIHVLETIFETTTVLKGMIIENGYSTDGRQAGGITNEGTMSLEDCVIRENTGRAAGGITNAGTLTILNSTISGNFAEQGGGITNLKTLTLLGSILQNNIADAGGAIWNEDATANVMNTSITDNHANHSGGAIYTRSGVLDLVETTFSRNTAVELGGAIYKSFGVLSITNSTFTVNSAEWTGGAIHTEGNITNITGSLFSLNSANIVAGDGGAIYSSGEGLLRISNSTLTNNSGTEYGGAIFSHAGTTLEMMNSTLSGNSAPVGAGIYNLGTLSLSNTIIANSFSSGDCFNDKDFGSVVLNQNNLIELNVAAPNNCGTPTLSLDPGLGSLADNGGPTQTMALLADSPAIDAGDDTTCATTDQRGIPRPQGEHCDIGAYEVAVIPVLIDPQAGEHVSSLRPLFDWYDVPNAIDYKIQISKNGSFTNLVKTVTVQTSQYSLNFNLPVNKTLFWRVRARTATGLTAWSEVRTFSTPNPPATPLLVSPLLHALNTNYTPLFRWSVVGLPPGTQFKHYQLQVDNNSDFSSPEINDTSVSNRLKPQFQGNIPLEPNAKFYWRVRAVNTADEFGSWSSERYFRSAMLPPVLLNPTDTEQLNGPPVFRWGATEGAARYQIVVARSENFSSPLLNVTVSRLSYTPAWNLPANKKLFWRVRGLGTNGPSLWSTTWSIVTNNPPRIPVLVSPANGSLTRDYTPTFNWSDSSVPANSTFKFYEIEVDDHKDFSSPAISAHTLLNGITDSVYTHGTDLDPNTRYYWRIRAVSSSDGNDQLSAWSVVRSLRTALQSPTLLAPADDSTNPVGTLTPLFNWSSVDGASSYTIQVSTSPSFSKLLVNATLKTTSYQRLTPFPANRLIYWRVRVNGVNGSSSWSPPFIFKTP